MLGRSVFSERECFLAETAPIPKDGKTLRVKVVGLNSALFAGYDGDDQGKLAFGLPQVEAALQKLDQEPHLTIALSHHPFTCFDPADKVCRNILMQHADLILTGHLHEPGNMFVRDAAGQAVLIGAGASFRRAQSRIHSMWSRSIWRPAQAKSSSSSTFSDHRWKINTDANPSHDRGAFQFTIERLAALVRVDPCPEHHAP